MTSSHFRTHLVFSMFFTALATLPLTAAEKPKSISVRCRIVDESGIPIESASIHIQLVNRVNRTLRSFDQSLQNWELTTAQDGTCAAIEVRRHAVARAHYLYCDVIAAGFVDQRQTVFLSHAKFQDGATIPVTVQMRTGKPVESKIIDVAGKPVANARVFVASTSPRFNCFPRDSNEQGIVRFVAPREAEHVIVIARAAGFAPQRENVFLDGESATIKLQHGAPVSGILTNVNGSPLSGYYVLAESMDKRFPSITVKTKTQVDGSFDMGQLKGDFLISTPSTTREWVTEGFVRSPEPAAVTSGLEITCRDESSPIELSLHCQPTLAVAGRITKYDGQPLKGQVVAIHLLNPRRDIELDWVLTDSEGRFQSNRVPRRSKNVHCAAIGNKKLTSGLSLRPKAGGAHIKFASRKGDFFLFKQLDDDVSGVNFQYSRYQKGKGFLPAEPE